MTTIREICCNDLLGMTNMMMGQESMSRPLSDYMSTMSEYPEYSLVAVAPGNQIEGYITAINVGEGLEKHCEIKEMHYLRGDMAEMLLKTVEETADNMHNVYYLEVDLQSDNEKYLTLFKKIGYTCSKEYYDVIHGELVNKTVLKKYLSGGGLHLLAETAATSTAI
ncbi:N-alpha-acetyltransferase 20-like [Papaver somniferum]|uniref:N-alpha-acetyltransferase 20-like n=1 Tax=Papaver somniferum TaxID=3469 RepID=UPI000E6FDA86|nr:N-alpha-acetyltransferase 20-like [Papaver somniferum]